MVRFDLWYDEAGDFILDNETGEYMTIEDACNRLNDYVNYLEVVDGFYMSLFKEIQNAGRNEMK